jgi:hypothetical protein
MEQKNDDSAAKFLTQLNNRVKSGARNPPQRAESRMSPLDAVLPQVVTKLGLERKMREHALMQVLTSLLPEAIARKSRPLFFDQQQNLVIAVKDASVAQEFSMIKNKIMKTLASTASSLSIELKGIRVDLKRFSELPEEMPSDLAPLPKPEDDELAQLTLNQGDMQLISELNSSLSSGGSKEAELNVMVLRTFEKQLRLAEWRRRHGYPICPQCDNPVARLIERGEHKLCFNCSLA